MRSYTYNHVQTNVRPDQDLTGMLIEHVISHLLIVYFRYPNVKCYAFCPPGCTVSMNLATECDDFVTSFVVGNDIIPR